MITGKHADWLTAGDWVFPEAEADGCLHRSKDRYRQVYRWEEPARVGGILLSPC